MAKKTIRIELPGSPVEHLVEPRAEVAPPAAPPSPPPPVLPAERFFRVRQRCRVPAAGGPYEMAAGMVVSSRAYDIEWLTRIGVPLDPVDGRSVEARAELL